MNKKRIRVSLTYSCLTILSTLCFTLSGCKTNYQPTIKPAKEQKALLHGKDIRGLEEEKINPKLRPAQPYGTGPLVPKEIILESDSSKSKPDKHPTHSLNLNQADQVSSQETKLSSALIAEVAANRANPEVALQNYLKEATNSKDIEAVKQLIKLAWETKNLPALKQGIDLWQKLAPEEPEAYKTEALYWIENKAFDQALYSLEKILKLKGNPEFQLVARAINTIDINQLLALETSYDKLLSQYPNNQNALKGLSTIYYKKSLIYERKKAFNKSLAELDKIQHLKAQGLNDNPLLESIANLQIQTAIKAQDYDQAINYGKTGVKNYPNNIQLQIQFNQAKLLQAANKKNQPLTKETEQALIHLAEYNKNNPAILAELPIIALEFKLDALEKTIKKLLSEQTLNTEQYAQAHYQLGKIAEQNKAYDTAITHYKNIKKGALFSNAQQQIIHIIAQKDGTNAAEKYIKSQQEQNLEDRSFFLLAEIYFLIDQKAYSQALELTKQHIGKIPALDEELYYLAGFIYLTEDKLQEMEEAFNKGLKINPQNVKILNDYGYTLADKKIQLKKAQELLEKAVKINQSNPSYNDSLGWVMYQQGEIDKALDLITWAFLKINFNHPEISAHLGEILWQKGDKTNAKWILKTALQENPDNTYLQSVIKKLAI